jgi:hypothetical protein
LDFKAGLDFYPGPFFLPFHSPGNASIKVYHYTYTKGNYFNGPTLIKPVISSIIIKK